MYWQLALQTLTQINRPISHGQGGPAQLRQADTHRGGQQQPGQSNCCARVKAPSIDGQRSDRLGQVRGVR